MRLPVERVRVGLNPSKVAPAASPVFLGVAVHHFLPEALSGHTNPVILPGNRGEIANDQERVLGVIPFSEVRYDAMVGVLKIDPFEPIGGEVSFIHGGMVAAKRIEVPDPILHPPWGKGKPLFTCLFPQALRGGKDEGRILDSSFEGEIHHSRRLWKEEGVTIHRNPFLSQPDARNPLQPRRLG